MKIPVWPVDMPPSHQWTETTLVPLSFRSRTFWYGGIAIIALVIAICGLQLIRVDTTAPFVHANADLSIPFFYNIDALLILPFVKETVETGTHWQTQRLGAPGIQELYDFLQFFFCFFHASDIFEGHLLCGVVRVDDARF